MPRTKIILGPPGTGKTTTLLNMVEDALGNGVDPERISYISFTKKAAEEAIERAVLKFPSIDRRRFKYFRTIHSMAFMLLQLERGQVLQQKHYDIVGQKMGLKINFKRASNPDAEEFYSPGDKCLRIYSLSRATKQPIKAIYNSMNDDFVRECNLAKVEKFAENLNAYKQQFNLLDYDDFLDVCVDQKKSIDVDVFIVDEAQDLTKQQWIFVKSIVGNNAQQIIAGDDDQAIYSWSGCDVGEFFGIEGERIVLPTSYRLPVKVWEHANYLSNKITNRIPKTWKPEKTADGSVEWVYDIKATKINLENGQSWLLLSRINAYVKNYIEFCRENGIVYHVYGEWSNRSEPIQAVLLYENMRHGKDLSYAELSVVLKYVKDAPKLTHKNKKYKFTEVAWPWEGNRAWMDCLNIPKDEKRYIIKLRSKNVSLINPGLVKISTIHGSKGGEADNVVVHVKLSNKIQKEMKRNRKRVEDEIRVWYVALTRSKNNVFLFGDAGLFPSF